MQSSKRTRAGIYGLLAASIASSSALANTKNTPAPAPRAAPARAPAMGGGMGRAPGGLGGGVHMPGNLGGGVHVPGAMGGGSYGGAHVPGNLGSGAYGGAHVPSSMAGNAHMPGSMGGGTAAGGHLGTAAAHVPGSMGSSVHAGGSAHIAGGGAVRASDNSAKSHAESRAGEHPAAGRTLPGQAANTHHEAGASHAQETGVHNAAAGHAGLKDTRAGTAERTAGLHAARADPRIGGSAALHTRGIAAGAAVGAGAALAIHGREEAGSHREARELPRPDEHRDIGRDRAFVAEHRADFHTRLVSGFDAGELGRWRGGFWQNDWHYGRLGWWWAVGDVWYPYADPVFPYPLVVAPLVAYDAEVVEGPGLQARALPPNIEPLPAVPEGQFSCASPSGYFPAVSACSAPWSLVQNAPEGIAQ